MVYNISEWQARKIRTTLPSREWRAVFLQDKDATFSCRAPVRSELVRTGVHVWNVYHCARVSMYMYVGGCMKTITDTCLRLELTEGPYGSTPCLLRAKGFSCIYKNNSHMGRKSSEERPGRTKRSAFSTRPSKDQKNELFLGAKFAANHGSKSVSNRANNSGNQYRV